ncbi:unnamed protein product [Caenorhabditis auriculariae]|uniref:Uncharacterized protein n=1 Tax=Caenorhabditis auriculariae TaxID=2777116 RepID=A0A8S1H262_9PELO|nr:unnamed protein product [Caenorhabditis auriculariae]
MHGPKRIFQGKGRAMGFWVMMCTVAMALLIFQTVQLLTIYFSKPTLSQVSFIVNDTGLHFPAITICNFNPIKKSHVRELNASGDLSGETLQYFLLTNADAMTIYSNPDRGKLKRDNDMAEEYIKNHTDFKITHFLKTAGYECEEMFKKCYFGGRRFECCQLMKPIITGLGKCFQLDLGHRGHEWMRKQKWPGVEAGLQIIADAHLEEVLSKSTDSAGPIFSNLFENGFRYYVHDVSQVPYLSSEGVSASPSTTVYSAIKTSTHQLLTVDEWGNCTRDWPPGYRTSLQYSAQSCKYLCLADHFMKMCNCSPFTYNIDGKRPICTPLQTVTCMGQNMGPFVNGSQSLNLPECGECRMECESTSYHAYNSYGNGFNEGALFWMQQNSENVTDEHIKKNYVIINIFFREMFYTAYTQVTATSLTEILSRFFVKFSFYL